MADDTKRMALNDEELEKISGGADIKIGYEGYGTVIRGPLENVTGLPWPYRYEVNADDGWTEVAEYTGSGILMSGSRVKIVNNFAGLYITRC